jgi:hypothetical protein
MAPPTALCRHPALRGIVSLHLDEALVPLPAAYSHLHLGSCPGPHPQGEALLGVLVHSPEQVQWRPNCRPTLQEHPRQDKTVVGRRAALARIDTAMEFLLDSLFLRHSRPSSQLVAGVRLTNRSATGRPTATSVHITNPLVRFGCSPPGRGWGLVAGAPSRCCPTNSSYLCIVRRPGIG